ncbi:DUF6074 family protein [Mesorhizobium sp. CO1-1-2]|uniref:DUF6074 family protein n=1 Tax=Mesorhizobium sp. CO1-1-2 TaxID=2876635 RepID=UPI001CCEE793|nr:DUF6074 family protein [Mesorhizobium sp. CO1-1-2]MBZ9683117.1 DUF6074 family protein [Mesorhizobium sp. CO1-1-2]
MTQLDLFKQARKPAQVVAFPTDRRATLVRATAHELCSLDYIAGRKFWSEHVKGIKADLRALGLTCRQADMEVRRYSAAVARIIDRSLLYRDGPDTAA